MTMTSLDNMAASISQPTILSMCSMLANVFWRINVNGLLVAASVATA